MQINSINQIAQTQRNLIKIRYKVMKLSNSITKSRYPINCNISSPRKVWYVAPGKKKNANNAHISTQKYATTMSRNGNLT